MQRKYTVLSSGLLLLVFLGWLLFSSFVSAIPVALSMYLSEFKNKYLVYLFLGIGELLLIAPLIGYMLITRTNVRALLGNRTNAMQIVAATAFGIFLAPAIQGLDALVSELLVLLGAKVPDSSYLLPDSIGTLLACTVAIGVFAGVVEEPIFRGVVQRGIASATGKHAAIALTALVFSLIHLEGVGLLARFIIGLTLGYMAWRSGSIVPGIFAHAAYNASVLAMPFLLNAAFPKWTGFDIVRGASADINGMLTWVLLAIPFSLAAFGVYRLFAFFTPASSAWANMPYARKSFKFVHSLTWIGVGIASFVLTAGVTLFALYSYKITEWLTRMAQYTQYYQ